MNMNLVCNKRCIHGVPRSVMFFYPPWVHVLFEMGRGRSRVRTIFFMKQDLYSTGYWLKHVLKLPFSYRTILYCFTNH